MAIDSCRPSRCLQTILRFFRRPSVGLLVAVLFGGSASALAPQGSTGSWVGPWTWLPGGGLGCEQTEFAHAALIPVGPLQGNVLLWKNTACNQDDLESWVFETVNPSLLIQIPTDFQSNIFCAGMSWNWQGHLLVTGGIRTPGVTPKETYRFVPHELSGLIVYPIGGGNPHYASGNPHWLLVDEMSVSRYYSTLVPLNRLAIDSNSLLVDGQPTPTINGSGHLVLGGPTVVPVTTISDGNESWEIFDHVTDQWSHTLVSVTNQQMVTTPREVYTELPTPALVDQALDSYPRAFQLAEDDLLFPRINGQVFVANDVDSDFDPTIPPPNTPGKSWVIKPPSATQPVGSWQMLHGKDEPRDSVTCPGGPPGTNCFTDRFFGAAVLMHTIDDKNRVLVFGGSQDPVDYNPIPDPTRCPSTWKVNASVREYVPGLSQDPFVEGDWREKAALNKGRVHLNAVILPTGQILIIGGNETDPTLAHFDAGDCSVASGPSQPVLEPELYDPGLLPIDLGSTRTLATSMSGIARLYHSLAILLPDASVLVAGGDGSASSFSGEIFRPPYLDLGTRPLILAAPMAVGFSTDPMSPVQFDVDVNVFGSEIAKVVLLRPAALTHHCDMDQRYIELAWTIDASDPPYADGTGTLIVDSPHETIGPAGYYMLFVVEVKQGGSVLNLDDLVPSEGHFVRLKNR